MSRVSGVHRPLVQPIPTRRRAGLVERVRLAAEILAAYAELLVVLRRNDLSDMVEGARCLRSPAVPLAPGDDPGRTAARIGRMVERVIGKLPTDKRCLIRSLVVVRLLTQRAIDSRIVIGVQSDDAGFSAHAWVEHEGRPVLPAGDFRRLVEL